MTNQQQILTVKAFEILETAEAAYYEARSESDYEFSPRFERNMERLIRAERRPLYPLVKTPARKVAVVLAALLLVFTLSMSISAVRTSVIDFFINVYETFSEFRFSEKTGTSSIQTVYEPAYLPENYTLCKRAHLPSTYQMAWKSKNDTITLRQYIANTSLVINTEEADYIETELFGQTVYTAKAADTGLLLWETDDYAFLLSYPSDLPWEEIELIFSSLAPSTEVITEP